MEDLRKLIRGLRRVGNRILIKIFLNPVALDYIRNNVVDFYNGLDTLIESCLALDLLWHHAFPPAAVGVSREELYARAHQAAGARNFDADIEGILDPFRALK